MLRILWMERAIAFVVVAGHFLDDFIVDSTFSSVLSSGACVALFHYSVGFVRDCNSFTFSIFTSGFITVRMFSFSVLKLGFVIDG